MMGIQRVVVCETQVPFVEGGAEALVRALVGELRRHGYSAELVSLPFKWYPKGEILSHAAAWRLLDLSESNGRPTDLVIATKFPTYFARHPNKVGWLIHQYRAAYELCGTPYSEFEHTEFDVGLRATLMELDRAMLSECRRLYTIAQNTSRRLERYSGLTAGPLYHPPRLADRLHAGPFGDYVMTVGRLESIKRQSLLIDATASIDRPIRLMVVGDGTERRQLEARAEAAGVADRVAFLGQVPDDQLIELYAGALAIVFVPYDEDYGYVTLEAFLAHKPLITARDSGGPLEFVEDGTNGLVCGPEPEAIAAAVNRLAADRSRAERLGHAGFERARTVTWDGVIERLVGAD